MAERVMADYRTAADQSAAEAAAPAIGYDSNHVPRYAAVICANCKRRPYCGTALHNFGSVGNPQMVCTDCFCYLVGTDPRDPRYDQTAQSGSGHYLTLDEWVAAGRPFVAAPLIRSTPPAAQPSWWARALRWVLLHVASER